MLLAGDEFGNTQDGNNNAYAQDNETGWLDWSGLESDPEFLQQVQKLLRLRRELPQLLREAYPHGHGKNAAGWHDIEWLNPAGKRMKFHQWHNSHALTLLLNDMDHPASGADPATGHPLASAMMFNAADEILEFSLPPLLEEGGWKLVFHSGDIQVASSNGENWTLPARSCACAVYHAKSHS